MKEEKTKQLLCLGIFDSIRNLEELIKKVGCKNGSTLELTNVVLRMEDLVYDTEYQKILNKLTYKESKDLEDKMLQEMNHYKMLEYGLLQKIEFNKFYFNENCEGSRKLIVHSEDCISTIQYIERKNFPIEICVHMRSSEVKTLLLSDLINILRIVSNIYNVGKGIIQKKLFNFTVLIGSAHIYPEGDIRRTSE